MYRKIDNANFINEFYHMGRIGQFSYKALNVLYDHLTAVEEDTGDKFELDVIALCCEWAEMTERDIKTEYCLSLDDLKERTTVLEVGNDIYLVQAF